MDRRARERPSIRLVWTYNPSGPGDACKRPGTVTPLAPNGAVGRLVAKCQAGRAIGFGDNMAFVGILSTMLLHEQFVKPATFAAPVF